MQLWFFPGRKQGKKWVQNYSVFKSMMFVEICKLKMECRRIANATCYHFADYGWKQQNSLYSISLLYRIRNNSIPYKSELQKRQKLVSIM